MRIAIDLQSCQTDSRNRGIGRLALNLVRALSAGYSVDHEIVVSGDAIDGERLKELRHSLRSDGIHADMPAMSYPHSEISDLSGAVRKAAGLLRSSFYAAMDPDILIVPSFFEFGERYSTALDRAALGGVPVAVIAHDVIPLLFPEHYLPEGQTMSGWYRQKVEEFKKFDLFLANSNSTRNDLVEHLGIDPQRIKVIGAGFDGGLVPPHGEQDILKDIGIREPFVLMVGNADWRKNSIGALEAFAALPASLRKRHQLVFTQVGDDVRNALKGGFSHLRDQVVVAGKVSETMLAQLYARCQVFFFPSHYEGFGLPVLEAMALGAPVLCSNQGALPEIVHDQRVLFDSHDPQAAAKALRRALEDEDFRQALMNGAREHALTFTWERSADATMEAISGYMSEHPRARASSEEWRPSQEEVGVLAEACMEMGLGADSVLRRGLQAIAAGGKRRILVDVTEVVRLDARSGIQRVVRNYLIGLASAVNRPDEQLVEPIQWTERGIVYARSYARDRLGIEYVGDDRPVEVAANDLLLMLDSSWWSPSRFDELKQQVREAGGEIVWVVYDLVPINYSQYCDPGMPPAFRTWLEHVIPLSDGFVCISEATRQELERFIDEAPISGNVRPWSRSLHLGSDLESGQAEPPSAKAVSVCEQLKGRAWLVALGTIEPRKDYPTVLGAFEKLWSDGVDAALVIIGKQGWSVDALIERLRSHPEQGKRLFWLQGLSDGDVQYLLANSAALVQASVAEGFGLPVVEAGSLGVPLILTDIPVFHEIAGDEASYFPSGDSVALADLIAHGVEHSGWKHPKQIKTMTWRESSEKLAGMLLRNT